ncbi:methyltransferase [Roseicyclus persicicus]|uniref:Methyltransferase domain-containing protein n=1 Tax=Roseicyclus persicicus TaxID=2650661 RepID=A0A7X6GZ60_9RHOB|nr:methyltransferase [Roseibacterium persicicum]NKX45080.1 methyltransferase domain-containing protein [Roseibacterium persicicum]
MAVADPSDLDKPRLRDRLYAWRTGLLRSRRFQTLAARTPLAARVARKDGEALFDLVAGFLHSQVLMAFVELDLAEHLAHQPRRVESLALRTGVNPDRMRVLCQAAAALGLMTRQRDGRYALGRLGAALPGIPGLMQMIRHHDVLYRDMADPVAFFRDAPATELAAFWPYVFGASGPIDPATAATYSELMAESQTLVAEEALRVLDLGGVRRLLDVGGGTGAFLTAVGQAWPEPKLHLFDLPPVIGPATHRFAAAGLADRATITGGSFRTDALPAGADAISLIRVLYDHGDATVKMLLAKAHAALPSGGRIIVSEPMSGGARPDRAGDAYFGLYCLAMGTGRARSTDDIAAHLEAAGFTDVRHRRTARPFITSVVEARKA